MQGLHFRDVHEVLSGRVNDPWLLLTDGNRHSPSRILQKETINNVLRSVCKELPCQRENVAYGANCPLPTLCEKRTCQVAYTSGMPSAVCEYFPLEPYSVCSFTGPNGWTVSGECADGSCRPRPTCPPDGVADVDCPVPKSCQIRKCSIFPTTTGAVRKCEYYNTCQQPPDSCQEACTTGRYWQVWSGCLGVFECLPRFCDDTFTKCDPAPVCKKISGCVEPDATTTPATVGSCTYGNLDAGTPCREGDKFGTCQASQVAGAMVCQLSNDLKWHNLRRGCCYLPVKVRLCRSSGGARSMRERRAASAQALSAPRPACCSDELKLCPDDVTRVLQVCTIPCQTITGCKETEKVCTYETKPPAKGVTTKKKNTGDNVSALLLREAPLTWLAYAPWTD
eukprot:g12829.t1